jgi:flagellar hook assembly protein FlgD
MKGKLVYDLTGLSKGNHTLTLKAWDNFNNSSVENIAFMVETDGKFIINNLINYPNPFFYETRIRAEHNRPDTELDITINIYSLNGRVIKMIRTRVQSSGFSIPPVVWDGKDDGGNRVGRGLYPYTVIISTSEGETCRVTGRMIIL